VGVERFRPTRRWDHGGSLNAGCKSWGWLAVVAVSAGYGHSLVLKSDGQSGGGGAMTPDTCASGKHDAAGKTSASWWLTGVRAIAAGFAP